MRSREWRDQERVLNALEIEEREESQVFVFAFSKSSLSCQHTEISHWIFDL